jgi:hypothetical protein
MLKPPIKDACPLECFEGVVFAKRFDMRLKLLHQVRTPRATVELLI